MKNRIYIPCAFLTLLLMAGGFSSCSTTSAIPDGEHLFTGLKKIRFSADSACTHYEQTQEEIEYVLASAPNGALFGSSYYRSPVNPKLWIWNAFSQKESRFAKWMTRAFGTQPKLMSQVNPRLRASVAESQLKKYGYFDGHVDYDVVEQHNPKKVKIAYQVDMGHLWTVDSVAYLGFPLTADSLMDVHKKAPLLHAGDAFSVPVLEGERQRLSSLFRNNGYYYYQPGYASYLADTVNVPGKVSLRLQLADSLSSSAMRQWYVGNVNVNLRQTFMEQLRDSLSRRHTTVRFNGRKPRLRPRVVLRSLKLRPAQLYRADNETETLKNLQSTGLFSYTSLRFTPRDTTSLCDTLDMELDCIFDKPYDFYVETNAKGKTTGRVGPELVVGFAKRNAFRGGEKLDVNLHGSYEWSTHRTDGVSTKIDTYEYGGDVSLEFPRLLMPWTVRRRFSVPPTTLLKASTNIINRAGYFRMHTAGGELTYRMQPSATSRHEWSPLVVEYQYLNSTTAKFDSIVRVNASTLVSMQDQFVPKMRYTYTYASPSSVRNPIVWEVSLTEAGNLLSLGYMAAGKRWNDKNKQLFKNPYAQFLKLTTDFTKTWRTGSHASLVGHLAGGAIWYYGNSESAPYTEQFWVGGANSIRAFSVRSIGPGSFLPQHRELAYLLQVGDIKLQANLEYRFRLAGSLYGATFLDAGNVWNMKTSDYLGGTDRLRAKDLLKDIAVGTGVGLRYDLDFFVVRVDWGIGLHLPYETGRSGYYNIPSFSRGQSLHLAIGYPF
ncbi:MAG: BamA/TamA family outer membrane protein [Prevotella sp.]|nr:BamA/TamA family outer membrane protein [Prevotella sp.]